VVGVKPYGREDLPGGGAVREARPPFSRSLAGSREAREEGEEIQSPLVRTHVRYIGQLNETYLLFQGEEGLLIVDQHAAHERVVYESLKRGYKKDTIERQSFLIPPSLEFTLQEARIIEKNLDQLARMGLEMDYFGGNTFLLRSVPSILQTVNWEAFLRELIPQLDHKENLVKEEAYDHFIALMACHNALRAGQSLSQQEIAYLLRQLEGMSLPTHCPHGRPIFKKIGYQEIEKMFGRLV
jgi:DNA mismatch repair protein MutL